MSAAIAHYHATGQPEMARRLVEAYGRRRDERVRYAASWDEQSHPRGQPENAGEFAPKQGGGKASSAGGKTVPHIPSPNVAAEPSPEAIRSTLSTAKPTNTTDLDGGCNVAMILDFPGSVQGVFKPEAGEMENLRDGVTGGTYWRREVAASQVADALGFGDLVPMTTMRKTAAGGGIDSSMLLAPDAARGVAEPFDGDEDLAGRGCIRLPDWPHRSAQGQLAACQRQTRSHRQRLGVSRSYHESDFFYNDGQFFQNALRESLPLPDMREHAGDWPDIEKKLVDSGLEPTAIDLTRQRFRGVGVWAIQDVRRPASDTAGLREHGCTRRVARRSGREPNLLAAQSSSSDGSDIDLEDMGSDF